MHRDASKESVAKSRQQELSQRKDGFGCTQTIVPPRSVRTQAFDWDYEIHISLPGTYATRSDKSYPVLWLTDGNMSFHLAVGLLDYLSYDNDIPEMIVVSVGCPRGAAPEDFVRRRNVDFAPPAGNYLYDGVGAEYMRSKYGEEMFDIPQKGDALLAFLIDELRPQLAREYRMANDHTLFGHSGGGMFASYALFARPGSFRRYIIVSPSSNAAERSAFRLEKEYAERNSDLQAEVFFGAGEREIADVNMAAWGIVSAPVVMAETLLLRQYPSLNVTTRIFSGKDHFTVVPEAIVEGLHAVWSRDSKVSGR